MEQVLYIGNLCKQYPGFRLQEVSFAVERGMIMGFIGRNGAGKTTTLKSIMNLVHPDSGEIRFFGMEPREREQEVKQRIGYAAGGTSYYHRKKIGEIIRGTQASLEKENPRLLPGVFLYIKYVNYNIDFLFIFFFLAAHQEETTQQGDYIQYDGDIQHGLVSHRVHLG